MCGIFATRPVVKSWLQSSILKHSDRGPDQKAIYLEKDIGIAVNRLAITGILDECSQPIQSNSGDSLCIFNGAIFNYKEMAKKFNLNPSSKNDGAVLLELYVLIGLKVFDFVQGMYAIIIIDRKKKFFMTFLPKKKLFDHFYDFFVKLFRFVDLFLIF